MPNPYLEKIEKKYDLKPKNVEGKWEASKGIVEAKGHEGNYGEVTNIFKKMIGKEKHIPPSEV